MTEHSSYPHHAGYLYDCPACESSCHCTTGNTECVYDGTHNGTAAPEPAGGTWEPMHTTRPTRTVSA